VNGFASTPYNVAVGGTDFSDTYADTNSTYWKASNDGNDASARSYIPEIPWNNTCASGLVLNLVGASVAYGSNGGYCNTADAQEFALNSTAAGSGGPSNCASGAPSIDSNGLLAGVGSCVGTAKPSWQNGVFGLPNDGVRDVPDVSLFASNGNVWGHAYIECYSDVANGGSPCTGTPDNWTPIGGTSISAPILAGIQALINQKTGAAQGNPNYVYYKLAASQYGSSGSASCNSSNGNAVGSGCIFYDVTQGDNVVPCFGFDCYGATGSLTGGYYYGVLSTSAATNSPAFAAQTGWDFATGIGTVNVANLVNNWSR
jgi:hypothetical protein